MIERIYDISNKCKHIDALFTSFPSFQIKHLYNYLIINLTL